MKINDRCEKCHKHKGTEKWVGDGGVLAWTHGWYKMWCKCCVYKEQIKFARKQVGQLEKLETKLRKTKCR